jgi:hypothetical protein
MFVAALQPSWFFVEQLRLLLVMGPTTVSRVVEHKQHKHEHEFLVLKSVRRQD